MSAEFTILIILFLFGPLLFALLLGLGSHRPRAPRLRVDLARMRWLPRTRRLDRWAVWIVVAVFACAVGWPEFLHFLFAGPTGPCWEDPLGNRPDGCESSAFWPTYTLAASAAASAWLVWPWLRARGRLYPREIVLDPVALSLDGRSIPLARLSAFELQRRGWPVCYATLVFQVEAEPDRGTETRAPERNGAERLRIAVDRERLEALEGVLEHLTHQRLSSPEPQTEQPVPEALRNLMRAGTRAKDPRLGSVT